MGLFWFGFGRAGNSAGAPAASAENAGKGPKMQKKKIINSSKDKAVIKDDPHFETFLLPPTGQREPDFPVVARKPPL